MSKPIALDKEAVRALAARLQADIGSWVLGREDDLREGMLVVPSGPLRRVSPAGVAFDLTDVRGAPRRVYVRVTTVVAPGPEFIPTGGFGTHVDSGLPVVELGLNARLGVDVIWRQTKHGDWIAREIYQVLLHELTHAADVIKSYQRPMSRTEAGEDLAVYLNEPREVAAYMQEVLHEIEHLLPEHALELKHHFGASQAASMVLAMSSTWAWAAPYWTPKNRRKVAKAVAARLSEAGYSVGRYRDTFSSAFDGRSGGRARAKSKAKAKVSSVCRTKKGRFTRC